MKLYGLKTCDTCRKARKTLEAAGHPVTYIDVRDDGVPTAKLERFLEAFGADRLINRRSTTWRDLSETAREQPPLALLEAHPTLMKRPVIETEDALHLGWGKSVQASFARA